MNHIVLITWQTNTEITDKSNQATKEIAQNNSSSYIALDIAKQSWCPYLWWIVWYLENFLWETHQALEEKGHKWTVCPFTPKVLKWQTVYFAKETIDTTSGNTQKIEQNLIEKHIPWFLELEANTPEEKRKLACLLITAHGPKTPEECNLYISQTQKNIQPMFVSEGLLLSELHPHSTVPSVRNAEFFPSRTPVPIFFVRRIIGNDIPYLIRKDRYDEQIYTKILQSLEKQFGIDRIHQEMDRLWLRIE